jgi:hypothetical protein
LQFLNLLFKFLVLDVNIWDSSHIIKIDFPLLGNFIPFLLESFKTFSQVIFNEEIPDKIINEFFSGNCLGFRLPFKVNFNDIILLNI